MRKLYITILIAFFGLSIKVNSQIVNIPDINFYNGLIQNGVNDSAGYITVDTASAFTGILVVPFLNIVDLTGIQAFTAIAGLDCSHNQLTSLDLSSNLNLAYLNCSWNNLTNLNIFSLTNLDTLYCFNNNLTSLDVSSNAALTDLDCADNNLSSLYVSSNTSLTYLNCSYNNLTSLNVSSNTFLNWLYCSSNHVTSMDLSSNPALTFLSCSYDSLLISLNVKNGNNHNILSGFFNAIGDTSLTCIQVDDTAYSNLNWTQIDPWTHFDTDCHYVGINEIAAIDEINIYPNPVTIQLIIETYRKRAENVKLYNVLGEIVGCMKPISDRITIDMNAKPAGIYFMQITDADKNVIRKKIIKQ